MSNKRREDKRKDLGLSSEKERKKTESDFQSAQETVKKLAKKREEIESDPVYKLVIKGAFAFDIIDGLAGFLEWIGDSLSSVFHLLNLYISVFVVKSFRLTLAVLSVSLVDLLVGFIPLAGSVLDFVFCSSSLNRHLIRGWVEEDEEVRSRVNKIASVSAFIVMGFAAIVAWLTS
jgi:hypothetical protein